MVDDLKTFLWFIQRPSLYPALVDLFLRKFFLQDRDNEQCKKDAKEWCQDNQSDLSEIFQRYQLTENDDFQDYLNSEHFKNVEQIIKISDSDFGGPGDLKLLYKICESIGATSVLETGVAYGWSAAAILESIAQRQGVLVSIDMPMPKQKNYDLIGVAVKKEHKQFWQLIEKPDKYGLLDGLKKLNGELDICHYDSDKSYYGRKWAYPKIYNALNTGGFLISDDVEDNLGFKDFVELMNLKFTVHSIDGKFVGIIQK
jgi:predicted O-methyltransferase YrrM